MQEPLLWLEAHLPPAIFEWLATLGVAAAALVLAEMVFRLGERVVRRATRSSPIGSSVAGAIRNPAHWVLLLVALSVVWQGAPDDLRMRVSVQRLTAQLLIGAVTWLLIRAIRGAADGIVAAHPLSSADNLQARRIQTQTRVLARTLDSIVVLIGGAMMLMTFPAVRQVGASLLASAGVLGIIAGLAARPVLGNMIAGLQIGLTQPIRLDDVVIVENEWGTIEEITSTYVVVRIWDQRRLVVPLAYWIEKPFQNWTRNSSELIGTVFLWVDYRMPLEPLRQELQRACETNPLWDKRVALLQVTDTTERAMQLRALVTAASSPAAWDLRCAVRESLIDFVQREYPQFLPTLRTQAELSGSEGGDPRMAWPGRAEPLGAQASATLPT